MASDPHIKLPDNVAYRLWAESLQRAWRLLRQATDQDDFELLPLPDVLGFGDHLGASTTDTEAFAHMKAQPRVAFSFLRFATELDKLYQKPGQMFDLSVSERGQDIPPFLILASATMNDMRRTIERDQASDEPPHASA